MKKMWVKKHGLNSLPGISFTAIGLDPHTVIIQQVLALHCDVRRTTLTMN